MSPEEIPNVFTSNICESRGIEGETGRSGSGKDITVPLQAFLCEMGLDRSL